MPDIFLYQGQSKPTDIILSDPTVAIGGGAPVNGSATPAGVTSSGAVSILIASPTAALIGVISAGAENNPTSNVVALIAGVSASGTEHNPLANVAALLGGVSAVGAEFSPQADVSTLLLGVNTIGAVNDLTATFVADGTGVFGVATPDGVSGIGVQHHLTAKGLRSTVTPMFNPTSSSSLSGINSLNITSAGTLAVNVPWIKLWPPNGLATIILNNNVPVPASRDARRKGFKFDVSFVGDDSIVHVPLVLKTSGVSARIEVPSTTNTKRARVRKRK